MGEDAASPERGPETDPRAEPPAAPARLDRETAELLEGLGIDAREPLPPTDIETSREASRALWLTLAGEDAGGCSVEDLEIEGGDGRLRARVYRPLSEGSPDATLASPSDLPSDRPSARAAESLAPSARRPLVIFFHGGGWSMGDLDCYDGLLRALAPPSGAIIVSVEYRLAPEHKFPAGLEDALAAVRWAARHADTLGGDPARIAIMGDSAGGNLATAAAQRLGAEGTLPLAAQFLVYPVLDVSAPHESYPSRIRYGDGDYLLSRESIDTTVVWYLDGVGDPGDPRVSPLVAEDLGNLPPTVIVTAGHDPLRDEGRLYAARLRAAGVPVEFRCFESTIHAFLSFGVLEVAREARAWLAAAMRRHLCRPAP